MISFLIFAYNEEKYISEAIESVLKIEDDIECILVDDNSTDSTYKIMCSYQQKDIRVKAYKNVKKGKNSAANYGISKCIGNWIMIVGGDDLFEYEQYGKFKEQLDCFDPVNQKVFIGGLVRRFSDNDKYQSENGVLNAFPKKGERRSCTNGFASRKIVDKMYPIPEQYPNEDSWASMYYYYFADTIINVPHVCLNYRIHDNNSINHNDDDFERFSNALHARNSQQLDFINKYRNDLSKKEIKYLTKQYQAEMYRFEKKYIKLLFLNIAFSEKCRLLLNSNKSLKKFKYKITKFAQQKTK